MPIVGIAIRACPPLPPTVEARIADNRAQAVADSVLCREAPGDRSLGARLVRALV